ncbi:hypothetical protein TNCV_1989271 [Trichonephila clavipes]|nr:hypothetical protein TNCV_1989271 [Trichonephila clavipes]
MCRWIDDHGRDKWINPLRTCPSLRTPSTPPLDSFVSAASPSRGNGDSSRKPSTIPHWINLRQSQQHRLENQERLKARPHKARVRGLVSFSTLSGL